MTNDSEADLKTLRQELTRLREDMAAISGTLQDLVRHGGAEAVGRAKSTGEQLRKDAEKLIGSAASQIEEKPVATVLSTFAIGLLLGILFSGRRS